MRRTHLSGTGVMKVLGQATRPQARPGGQSEAQGPPYLSLPGRVTQTRHGNTKCRWLPCAHRPDTFAKGAIKLVRMHDFMVTHGDPAEAALCAGVSLRAVILGLAGTEGGGSPRGSTGLRHGTHPQGRRARLTYDSPASMPGPDSRTLTPCLSNPQTFTDLQWNCDGPAGRAFEPGAWAKR